MWHQKIWHQHQQLMLDAKLPDASISDAKNGSWHQIVPMTGCRYDLHRQDVALRQDGYFRLLLSLGLDKAVGSFALFLPVFSVRLVPGTFSYVVCKNSITKIYHENVPQLPVIRCDQSSHRTDCSSQQEANTHRHTCSVEDANLNRCLVPLQCNHQAVSGIMPISVVP